MSNLALDDVLQVTYRCTLFGQRILTVLHYFVDSTAGTEDVLSACQRFATQFGQTGFDPLNSYWLATCPELSFDECRVQRISPTRDPYRSFPINDAGQFASAAFTANVAVSIDKKTAKVGRFAVGRMQMAGGPVNQLTDGEWSAPYRAAELNALATALTLPVTLAGPLQRVRPCLYNPGLPAPHYTEVISAVVQREQRTMHRRTLRVGE